MKTEVLVLCTVLVGAASAASLQPDALPRSPFADTEMSTNCPFSFASPFVADFRLTMEFDSTPSNNVQIAFGWDADADGVLSAGETDMALAWDCGEWMLIGTNALSFAVSPAVDTNAHKVLHWDLHLRGRRPKRLVLTENDVQLFPDFETDPEPWLYDRTWDMFRLTARGIDNPSESFLVNLDERGTQIFLR